MIRSPFFLVLLLVLLSVTTAWSQPASEPSVRETLDAAERSLEATEAELARNPSTAELAALREQTIAARSQADAALGSLTPRLEAVEALIAELGTPAEGVAEAPEVQARRRSLTAQLEEADAAVRRARLLAAEAGQLADRIAEERRARFNAQLFERSYSPLEPGLWREVAANWPGDIARLAAVWEALTADLADLNRTQLVLLGVGLVAGFLLVIPLWLWLERLGRRRALEAPPSPLRRSGTAAWTMLFGSVVPVMAAVALVLAFKWAGPVSPITDALLQAFVEAVGVAAVVMALSRALLAPGRTSWRLAPLSDKAVRRFGALPPVIAGVSALGVGWKAVNEIARVSLPASILTDGALALAYAGVTATVLLSAGRSRRKRLAAQAEKGETAASAETPAWAVIALIAWLAVLATVAAVLTGYVALGFAVARQTLWVALVAGVTYVLLRFVDDLFTTVLSGRSRIGRQAYLTLGLRPGAVEQLGVVLSAVVRVMIVLVAVGAVATPFGADTTAVLSRLGRAFSGFTVGEMRISPGAIFGSVLAFAVGVGLARLLRGWLDRRYLPTTELDPGVRNSISTAVGYLGVILAGFWAFATLGIGFERLALVASALSVGIGFGLQAIVQNFISGLIMLAERPVKVGDWISVGDQEGDVRRINVRATEIQLFDRSTLLVPNSEFITKPVHNMTLGGALGRMQLRLGVSHDTDPERVKRILLETFEAAPVILDDPPPVVQLDAVLDSGIFFNAFAYVANPRDVSSTRSDMLFAVLGRFREEGVALARPQQDVRISNLPAPD